MTSNYEKQLATHVQRQLDAADELSRAQSAREAYRAHLVLAVDHPQLAAPENACAVMESDQATSYYAFVDHLIYAAEQMLSVDPEWAPTFMGDLAPHAAYFCAPYGPQSETDVTELLFARFRAEACATAPSCEN